MQGSTACRSLTARRPDGQLSRRARQSYDLLVTQSMEDSANAGWLTAALAEELRAQLARKRMSGREMARRLHVSAQWMSQRTRGEIPLRADEMERIADTLGITIYELIGPALKNDSFGTSTFR